MRKMVEGRAHVIVDAGRTSPAPVPPGELGPRRRIGILLICCMSLLMVGMDNTIVNVALPSIGRDLHATVSGLQWTVDAYIVVLASLLMLSGSAADSIGRKRTFQMGLVLFTSGSLLCSLAPGLLWLVAFRMVQAVGGSMLTPVAMSIIRNTFHDPRERAQAIGAWGAVVGISIALGPVIGGVLVQSVGWRSIFWVNIPVGALALALTGLYVPESRADQARRADPVGQLLVMVVLAAVTFGVIEGPAGGWGSAEIVGVFAAAAVAFMALLRYEPRRPEPLLELRFFRSVPFSGATVIAIASFAAYAGFLFLNTLYLQEARHLSALDAGLYTLPMAASALLMSPLAGWLIGRFGSRLPLVIGGSGMSAAGLLLTGLSTTTSHSMLIVIYLLFGIGFGFVNPTITDTAIAGMPASQAGVAAAVASTSRQVGASLGVAVIGVAATAGIGTHIASRLARASHPGWWIMTACSLLVLVLGFVTTTARARRTAFGVGDLG